LLPPGSGQTDQFDAVWGDDVEIGESLVGELGVFDSLEEVLHFLEEVVLFHGCHEI